MDFAVSWYSRSSTVQDACFFIGLPFLLCACLTVAGPDAAQIGLWTDEDDFRLRAFVAEGLPPRLIAAHMQRTFHAVRARTVKLGLKNNKP